MMLPGHFLTYHEMVDTGHGLADHVRLEHPAGFYFSWYSAISPSDDDTRRVAAYYEEAVWHSGIFRNFPELLDPNIPASTWIKFRDLTDGAWERHRLRGDYSHEAEVEVIQQYRDILDALLTPCDEPHNDQ